MATIPFEYDSLKFSLYAINILLQSINELPVADDTEIAELVEAQLAESVLEEVKKDVLAKGWDINIDTDFEFSPDSNGEIALPANILDISDSQGDLYMRNWRLYSKSLKSFTFEETQLCDVTWDLDFNSLPHALRYYITVKASRTFQYRQIGDTNQYQFTEDDLQTALYNALHSDGFTGKYSLKDGLYGLNYQRSN